MRPAFRGFAAPAASLSSPGPRSWRGPRSGSSAPAHRGRPRCTGITQVDSFFRRPGGRCRPGRRQWRRRWPGSRCRGPGCGHNGECTANAARSRSRGVWSVRSNTSGRMSGWGQGTSCRRGEGCRRWLERLACCPALKSTPSCRTVWSVCMTAQRGDRALPAIRETGRVRVHGFSERRVHRRGTG